MGYLCLAKSRPLAAHSADAALPYMSGHRLMLATLSESLQDIAPIAVGIALESMACSTILELLCRKRCDEPVLSVLIGPGGRSYQSLTEIAKRNPCRIIVNRDGELGIRAKS